MSFNNSLTHPLIKKVPNYLLDSKIISIHSEDRDLRAWRHANHFEVELPDVIKNVQSIRLVDSYLPINNADVPENTTGNKGQTHVYIEIEKFNSVDELEPYPVNSNATKHNRAGGRKNASFAIIPIVPYQSHHQYTSDSGDNSTLSYYNPPIEKVSKLKLKFRYHNGDLVNFLDKELHLTIEINSLLNEHKQIMNITTPAGNFM